MALFSQLWPVFGEGKETNTRVLVYCVLVPFLMSAIYIIYIRIFSSLAKIPGPLTPSLSRLWLAYHSRKGDMHIAMQKLHGKYGKTVRTAPDEISTADTAAIHQIYGPGSRFIKSDWYSVWQGVQKTDLFAERNIAVHSNLRRNISRMYAMSSLTVLEKWVDDTISCFMQIMHDQRWKSCGHGLVVTVARLW